jgi:hypothetical protein
MTDSYSKACQFLEKRGFKQAFTTSWKDVHFKVTHPYVIFIHPVTKVVITIEGYAVGGFDVVGDTLGDYTKDRINNCRIWACWKLKAGVTVNDALKDWPDIIGCLGPSWLKARPSKSGGYESWRDPITDSSLVQMSKYNTIYFSLIIAMIQYFDVYAEFLSWQKKHILWLLTPEEIQEEQKDKPDEDDLDLFDISVKSEKRLLDGVNSLGICPANFGF